jgi:hypothetical protein
MRAWVADRDTSLCVHTSSILSRPNGIQFEEMDGAQSGAKGENTVTRYTMLVEPAIGYAPLRALAVPPGKASLTDWFKKRDPDQTPYASTSPEQKRPRPLSAGTFRSALAPIFIAFGARRAMGHSLENHTSLQGPVWG